jgi:monoamine oxidase
MKAKISNSRIQYNKRVTSITPSSDPKDKPLIVDCADTKEPKKYDYVISTAPLSALRYVNLDGCNLSYAQLEGLRCLRYDSSCKIGLKFRTRWWQTLESGSIKGGQSKTDRNIRTVVFPSYGIDDPDADAVMIASYTWSQDAMRIGGLTQGRQSASEKMLIEQVIRELAELHKVVPQKLMDDLEDWYAWDWYSDPHSLGNYGCSWS